MVVSFIPFRLDRFGTLRTQNTLMLFTPGSVRVFDLPEGLRWYLRQKLLPNVSTKCLCKHKTLVGANGRRELLTVPFFGGVYRPPDTDHDVLGPFWGLTSHRYADTHRDGFIDEGRRWRGEEDCCYPTPGAERGHGKLRFSVS